MQRLPERFLRMQTGYLALRTAFDAFFQDVAQTAGPNTISNQQRHLVTGHRAVQSRTAAGSLAPGLQMP